MPLSITIDNATLSTNPTQHRVSKCRMPFMLGIAYFYCTECFYDECHYSNCCNFYNYLEALDSRRLYYQTLDQTGKACQGQTLQLIACIHKLQRKQSVMNTAPVFGTIYFVCVCLLQFLKSNLVQRIGGSLMKDSSTCCKMASIDSDTVAYPGEAPLRCSTLGQGHGLVRKHQTRLEMPARDKQLQIIGPIHK